MKKALFAAILAVTSAASFAGTNQAAEVAPSAGNEACVSFVLTSSSFLTPAGMSSSLKSGQLCGAEVLAEDKVAIAGTEFSLPKVRRADDTICQAQLIGISSEEIGEGVAKKVDAQFGWACRPAA